MTESLLRPRFKPKLLSLVIPLFNEEEVFQALRKRLTEFLQSLDGQAEVILDADLQDPPEVIHEMLLRYQEGYDVVYGQRAERAGETLFKRATAFFFYRLMRLLIHPDLPADAGDFRLMSRPVVKALLQMRERHRFLRGMVAWLG